VKRDYRVVLLSGCLFLSAAAKVFALISADDRAVIQVLGRELGVAWFAMIILLEIAVAAGLLSRLRQIASAGGVILFFLFGGISVITWLQGEDLSSCGCFGAIEVPVTGHFLLVAGGLLLSYEISADGKQATK